MAKMYGKGKTAIESEEQQKLRWQVELEFVQCLANPNYLNFLAQRGYFKDQAFINYIKYLQYWKEPEYAKYLMYPMCLYFLDLLQFEHFRREIVSAQCCKFIDEQAILQWQHYTRKRIKMLNAVSEGSQQIDALAGGGGAVASVPGITAVGSEATTAEQIQQQQQLQPQSAQKTNPSSGGLHNGLNAGQAGVTQPQTLPPMQQQTQQQQQQGSTTQQQQQQHMNGVSANPGVGMANIKLELS